MVLHNIPTVPLSRTGDGFPQFGLGVWKAEKGVTAAIVEVRLSVQNRFAAC